MVHVILSLSVIISIKMMANNSTKKRIDEPVCPSPLHYA